MLRSDLVAHTVVASLFFLCFLLPASDAGALTRVAHVGASINCVAASGNFAYVGEGAGLRVLDVSNPTTPNPRGKVSLNGYCSDIARIGDYAYCTLLDQGLQVVDVSNPGLPQIVYTYSVSKDSDAGVWWSCIYVTGNLAYIGSGNGGAQSGIHIFDVSNPATPRLTGHFRDTPSYPSGMAARGKYLYVAYRELPSIQILDVSNPAAIFLAGTYQPGAADLRVEDILIEGSLAYLSASFQMGVAVLDLTDPLHPVRRGTIDTPNVATRAVKAGDYLYVSDLWDKPGIICIDATNPDNLRRTSALNLNSCVGVGHFTVSNNRLYVPANTELRIFDVTNQGNPALLGSYSSPDPLGRGWGLELADGFAYVCDFRAGIKIFDISDPGTPLYNGQYRTTAEAADVEVIGNTAYVCNFWGQSMDVLNISSKSSPTRIRTINFTAFGWIRSASASGSYLYVAGSEAGIYVLDISTPTSPILIRRVQTGDIATEVAISEGRLLVADGTGGLKIYSLSNPSNPSLLASRSIAGNVTSVDVQGDRAVVGIIGPPQWVIQTYDISIPSAPQLTGSAASPYTESVAILGNKAYSQSHKSGVWEYDITMPANPVVVDKFDTEGAANRGIGTWNGYLFSSDGFGGLNIFATDTSKVPGWQDY